MHPAPLPLPSYQTQGAAGLDLSADIEQEIMLAPLQRLAVPTGICVEIPFGFEGQIRPRSGLALKYGITCLNSPGTIDSDYRGELKVILVNLSNVDFPIRRGERIAQLIIAPVVQARLEEVEALELSVRGDSGFGSTGR